MIMKKQAAVYILASKYNGTLYPGVTSTLIQRIWQHKVSWRRDLQKNIAFIFLCITNCMKR